MQAQGGYGADEAWEAGLESPGCPGCHRHFASVVPPWRVGMGRVSELQLLQARRGLFHHELPSSEAVGVVEVEHDGGVSGGGEGVWTRCTAAGAGCIAYSHDSVAAGRTHN